MLIYTTLFSHSRVRTTLLVPWGHSQKIRYMRVPQALVHLVFLNVCVWYLFVSLSVLWVRAAHQSICGGLVHRSSSVKFVNKQKCGPVHGFSVPCRIPKQETDKGEGNTPFVFKPQHMKSFLVLIMSLYLCSISSWEVFESFGILCLLLKSRLFWLKCQ